MVRVDDIPGGKKALLRFLVDAARELCGIKLRSRRDAMRREITKALFLRQTEEIEGDLAVTVAPLFEEQVREIARGLEGMEEKVVAGRPAAGCPGGMDTGLDPRTPARSDVGDTSEPSGERKDSSDAAASLVAQVFNPGDPRWYNGMVDLALPVMAVGMAEAAVAAMLEVGIDPRKSGRKGGRNEPRRQH